MPIPVILIFALSLFLLGCSNDNEIEIVNSAQEQIMFNFRAKCYTVENGTRITIDDIPNGTFDYATTFAVPSGVTEFSSDDDAAAGYLCFEKRDTKHLLIYSSTLMENAYTLYVNRTSTRYQESLTGP